MTNLQFARNGADFSDDRVYRYRLWREWDDSLPSCLFVMLNPSTADATQDDPTIRRCIDYARGWGYGALTVGNLFALRATDPTELYRADDPVGEPANDDALMAMHEAATLTVLAWGVHGGYRDRDRQVLDLLGRMSWRSVYCLGATKNGSPRHPLYRPKTATAMMYEVI